MTAVDEGRRLFEERMEYPLPALQGTADYVFYFVGAGDDYGKAARRFFTAFYPEHRKREVQSLEGLIARLHAEITTEGVSDIREVVIVSHGTNRGLIAPVVEGATDPELEKYKFITAASLAELQAEILEGRFEELDAHRRSVVACLSDLSWVTVRACNFGKDRAGMYAFYSFFGGKANVYSPKVYQVFGTHPILPGMRLESRLAVHNHLVKQRFLPNDVHTAERQEVVVQALASPGRYSDPMDLVTADLGDSSSPETQAYQALVADLNSRAIRSALTSRLGQHGISLSSRAKAFVNVRDAQWVVEDVLDHAGERHTVEYLIREQVELPEATLVVEARIPDIHAANDYFPIQLFFAETENKVWTAWMFTLVGYAEEPDADPADQQKLEAIRELLNNGRLVDDPPGTVSLIDLFEQEGITLSQQATVSLLSSKGDGTDQRRTWLLQDVEPYQIKLEHPRTRSGVAAHTISVYEHLDGAANRKREHEMLAYLGEDPDQPGTELLAYLDSRSFEELTDMLAYLRDPYEPEKSVYIHHVIEAIKRKQGFLQWFASLPDVQENEGRNDPLFSVTFPLTNLSLHEREDKSAHVYDFDPNAYWGEVRASNPAGSFQQDLFLEEMLPAAVDLPSHLEPDSPYTDIDELREATTAGLERFFTAEKFVVETSDIDQPYDLTCAEFAAFIVAMKGLQGMSPEEVAAELENITIVGDLSLFMFIIVPKPIKWALDFWTAAGTDAGIAEAIVAALIDRAPALGLGTFRLTPVALHVTRALPYVGIATMIGEMFYNYLKDLGNTLERWEQVGKLTAIRQYSRELRALARSRRDDFPTELSIDIGSDVVALFFKECRDESGVDTRIVFSPRRMQEGFDEGIQLISNEASEVLARAERIIEQSMLDAGLDSCKIRVLRDEGIIDPAKVRALVMEQYAEQILEKTPKL